MTWGFYGRGTELAELEAILQRPRWFFARITGRRRIGKTTLIQQALQATAARDLLYVQIPDSAPAGVLSAVAARSNASWSQPPTHRPNSARSSPY